MGKDWITSKKERRSYWSYFAGQNMMYTYVTMFLATYLLLCGIDPAATAAILLIVKIWDAVNDILFGTLIDRLKFKNSGKFMPWLRISLPFIAISVLLLFWIPLELSAGAKLIWLTCAYLLFSAAYTICDVPIYGMLTTMTSSQAERTELMAKSRITSYIGVLLVLGFGFVLPAEQVGMSFTRIAQIIVAIAIITMIWHLIYGKEHLTESHKDEKSYTLREMGYYLVRNKYMLIFFGGLFLFSGLNTATGVVQFACFYFFDSAMLATVIAAISFVPTVIIAFFLPMLLKNIDKMKVLFISAAAYTVFSVIIWAIGPILVPHLALSVLRGFALGGVTVLQFMFTPDCAEYGQYKTGTSAKGITFAMQTFTMKLVSAVSVSLGLAVLSFFGWVSVNAASFAELAELGVSQTRSALTGLWTVYSLIPMIGSALAVLLWTRYKLPPGDVELMIKHNTGEITRDECDRKLSRVY